MNQLLILLFRDGRANTDLLLTEREGRTGNEVVVVRTEHSEVRTKIDRGHCTPPAS